jgi:UDP:flavonoid glycosyltransferase YjiC (YdhE family)
VLGLKKGAFMKFAVVTYGTEGDARPLAALCAALIDAGHEAILLADASTLSSADALGVPSAALSGDIRKALMPGEVLSTAVREKGGFNSTAKALAAIANANTSSWMQQVLDATVDCDAIIVAGLAAFVGLSVAEYRGIMAIGAGLIPITPTAEFPSPFLPPGKVPRWLNKTSHRLVNALLWKAFRRATNSARADVCGLSPQRKVWTEHPMLYGLSSSLLPQPTDWPSNARVCGQWSTPYPEWTPPPDLEKFLAAGEAPIYIGFGSMAGFDRSHFVQVLIDAVGGRRALFYPGWSGMDAAALPDNFLKITEVPHHWLFPRTSVVVHHGGAGTTHSAARAGVPSVVLPFAGDQFFWAERLQRIGIAGDPVVGKKVRSAELKRAIAFAERNEVRARVSELGVKMAAEDGLGKAVAAIEELVRASS